MIVLGFSDTNQCPNHFDISRINSLGVKVPYFRCSFFYQDLELSLLVYLFYTCEGSKTEQLKINVIHTSCETHGQIKASDIFVTAPESQKTQMDDLPEDNCSTFYSSTDFHDLLRSTGMFNQPQCESHGALTTN